MSAQTEPFPSGESYYGGHGPAIVAVCWPMLAIGTILVSLRIYTYLTIVKNVGGWAIIWACVALILAAPSVILYTLAAVNGLGNHIWIVVTSPHLSDALLYEWIAAVTISFSIGFAKLGTMFYILDIQRKTNQVGRWTLYIAVAVNFVCYIVNVPMIFTQCYPKPKLWQTSLPGDCSGLNRAYYWAIFTGAWGAATNLLLTLYPVFLVYSLQIKLGLKLIISFLMGLGVFTAVCSIVKTFEFYRLITTTDPTYEIAPLLIWGVTEMLVIIIASSVAPLWPLLRTSATHIKQKKSPSIFSKNYLSIISRDEHSNKFISNNNIHSTNCQSMSHAKFQRMGSQTNLREAMVSPNSIEIRKDFSIKHESILSVGEERASWYASFEP